MLVFEPKAIETKCKGVLNGLYVAMAFFSVKKMTITSLTMTRRLANVVTIA